MAARIRRIANDENTRAKIKTTQLVKRLSDHAFGELELSPSQIKAIEILIRKTLPDLSAINVDGNLNITAHEQALDELERAREEDQGGTEG